MVAFVIDKRLAHFIEIVVNDICPDEIMDGAMTDFYSHHRVIALETFWVVPDVVKNMLPFKIHQFKCTILFFQVAAPVLVIALEKFCKTRLVYTRLVKFHP